MKKDKTSKEKSVKNIQENKGKFLLYLLLRALVLVVMIAQIINKNWDNVFLCVFTLVLFMIPSFVDKELHIKMPTTLEVIILLFIFSAEILGEIQEYYLIFDHWDAMLHTINGFLMAAIGFSLIDILNENENFSLSLSPIFVAVFAFCFSMTIGVLWEFFEYGMDKTFNMDMQKDRVVSQISSVNLNEEKKNEAVTIKNIEKTQIYGTVNKSPTVITIDNGYLDIGINDTMKDLLVNFVGAVVFSILGLLYIKNRDEYKFTEEFMPMVKTEEEIEETRQELERLEKVLEQKKQRKQHENK